MGEEIILRVGVTTEPAALAGSIYKNIMEGKTVHARAFGRNANFQLCKGVGIVHEFFRSHDREVYTQTTSQTESDDIRSFTVTFHTRESLQD